MAVVLHQDPRSLIYLNSRFTGFNINCVSSRRVGAFLCLLIIVFVIKEPIERPGKS
jgi:hypothetical protein